MRSALLTVAARRLAVVLTAAGLLATVAGLIITIEAGLFGLRETGRRYVRRSLYAEIAGAIAHRGVPGAWAGPGVDAAALLRWPIAAGWRLAR